MRAATASFLAVLLAAPLTVACGGGAVSPIGPTQNPTAPRVDTLTPGSYFLALAGTSENVTTPGGQTFSTYLCAFVGSNSPTSGKFLVTLEPADSSWVVRAANGNLKFTFSVDGDSVLGQMYGTTTSVDAQVRVEVGLTCAIPEGCPGGPSQSAQVTGTFTATDAVAGGVKGQVNFSGNGVSSSCSANAWTLSRR
jgi:hypothetical protein